MAVVRFPVLQLDEHGVTLGCVDEGQRQHCVWGTCVTDFLCRWTNTSVVCRCRCLVFLLDVKAILILILVL